MHPTLHPRLLNSPFEDPCLYIQFLFENYSILFDLGDIARLPSRDILKISHIFVSHTHMDHFLGFDRVLRLCLGRDKVLHLYGPAGFLKNVEGKLSGYSWNLVTHYNKSLILNVTEIHHHRMITRSYDCKNRFIPIEPSTEKPFQVDVVHRPGWTVSATVLDHGIPCLAFSIAEKFHINIKKDRIEALGLTVGPWITAFKQAILSGKDSNSIFRIDDHRQPGIFFSYPLGKLCQNIASITPGQKITYITDVAYNDANAEKIVNIARNSDQLFIEAAFMEIHRDLAAQKYHLTACQAGTLAAMARAKHFTIFHHSPRYVGQEALLNTEAHRACHNYLRGSHSIRECGSEYAVNIDQAGMLRMLSSETEEDQHLFAICNYSKTIDIKN